MFARDDSGAIAPLKIMNQRAFLRWGPSPQQASRIILPGLEILGTDALALVEAFERPLPTLRR